VNDDRPIHSAGRGFHNRMTIAALLVLLPIVLAACTPAPPRPRVTRTLAAADVANHYRYDVVVSTWPGCSTNAPGGGEFEPISEPPSGTAVVGFDNFYREVGLCSTKLDYIHRAGVRFDLGSIRSLKGAFLERATLTWTVQTTDARGIGGAPRRGGPGCQIGVFLSNGDIHADGPFLPGTGPIRTGPGDVTYRVRDWLLGVAPNRGFVLTGPDEGFQENNAACLVELTDLTLELTYLASL
jgi:hypothetical protein